MKIYTKTGDKGETGVVGGRLSKTSTIIDTIGTFDELNASIGIIHSHKSLSDLLKIQNIIFCIGSILSGTNVECDFEKYTRELELNIDRMNSELPELTQFILPGGSIASSYIHLTRTICRRSERRLIDYIKEFENEKPRSMQVEKERLVQIQKFVNRLSDYLFVLARYTNKQENILDINWNKSIE